MKIRSTIPFSPIDGPGNRFVVFFQGCNINCGFCHNPETIPQVDLPQGLSIEEVMASIDKASPFIQGVTFSGGEPTLFAEEIIKIMDGVKGPLDYYVDSNFIADKDSLSLLAKKGAKFMVDIKACDPDAFLAITGHRAFDLLKENLEAFIKEIHELRFVLVAGINDHVGSFEALLRTVKGYGYFGSLVLIPMRNHGVRRKFTHWQGSSQERVNILKSKAEELGFSNIIVK